MRFEQRLGKIEKALSHHGEEVFVSISVPWDADPEVYTKNQEKAMENLPQSHSKKTIVALCADFSGCSTSIFH